MPKRHGFVIGILTGGVIGGLLSLKQEKPPRLSGLLVIKNWCRRSESNRHRVTSTGF